MKRFLSILILSVSISVLYAQNGKYELKENISYAGSGADEYSKERCQVDVYYPKDKKDFVTILWFHGGGLTGGGKEIPSYLKDKGVAVIGVGYRLSPKVKVEDIIQDAAKAVRWTFNHIGEYGGNNKKIVLSGHSAGGYLNLMLALNPRYLKDEGIDADQLYGVVPFSAQCISHFTARSEKGIDINQPVVDEFAPLFWVRKNQVPITLITGDRELEMVGRYEENAYLARMLKIVGHPQVKLLELDGYDHGMTYPAFPLLLKEIERWNK
ncbi:alpha/beta hydrolase [Sphingobacterium endophyticum]|uniref:alpha/beta hydrolase n=1 Tax=Sphingobacterium endophyticum TaxID=2546448 RepID=UPI0012E2EDEB|nr:alpha/beta hydrolase [Sphingobacterium endophyticum]